MKLKEGIITDQLDTNQFVAVATGESAKGFNGLIRYNKTGAYLFELLKEEQTEESLVAALMNHYNVSDEIAHEDVKSFLTKLREVGLINE